MSPNPLYDCIAACPACPACHSSSRPASSPRVACIALPSNLNHRKPTHVRPRPRPRPGQARAKSVWSASTTDISLFPACRRRRVITTPRPQLHLRACAPTLAYHCLSCRWPVLLQHPPDQIAIATASSIANQSVSPTLAPQPPPTALCLIWMFAQSS